MPLDKFGNRYEIIPAVGPIKDTRNLTGHKQEELQGTVKSPCRPNTPVCDIKLKTADCDGEGPLKANNIGGHSSVRATLAAALKEKLLVFMEAQLKAEVTAGDGKMEKVIHKEEAPVTYEEWFDKPGEVDTLGDILVGEDTYGIGY